MTTFDISSIKEAFTSSIRTYVFPYQSSSAQTLSLNDNSGVVNQELWVNATSISSYGVYVTGTIGTPTGLSISLIDRGVTVASSSLAGTVGWNVVSTVVTGLSTARASTLRITGVVSSSNDVYIGKDTSSTYYFGGASTLTIAFTIGIENFVYKAFPLKEFDANNFPLISIDVVGRPSIDNRYLSGDMSWFNVTVKAEVYSKYTQQLDKLCYAIDRGIFHDRKVFLNSYFISPAYMSPISYVKPEVYSRELSWSVKQLIHRE